MLQTFAEGRRLCLPQGTASSIFVRDLIATGADVNLNRSPDPGPLAIAAEEGHADVANVLLEAGANVSHRDRAGQTALDLAQESGHGEIAAVLRKRMRREAGGS
jgi:ankyrin repeat protein